jgi:hypothetical protein
MTRIAELARQLDRVAALLDEEPDATPLSAPRVSGWSVAEQVDHLLKIVVAQLGRMAERRQSRRGINLPGRIVLGIGRIPRGVGKSPEAVRGEPKSRDELRAALAAAREKLHGVAADAALCGDPRPLVGHPYFGGLTPGEALRFLAIHTDHHLRIVERIRRAAS